MNVKNEPGKTITMNPLLSIDPLETWLQKNKVQLRKAMVDKLTPPPTVSTIPLTLLEVPSRNPPPSRTGPKDILSCRYKLKVERLMGDFTSWHGWTATLKYGHSSVPPQTSLPPHSQPNTKKQTQIPTLTEFEKLTFDYLLKQGEPHS